MYTFHGILIRMGRSFVLDSTSLIRYCKTTTDHLVSPQYCSAVSVHHRVGDWGQVLRSHERTIECVGALLGRAFLSHPRVLTLTASALADRRSCPCVDTFCLGTRQQGRRPIRATDSGMWLYPDVIRWCRSGGSRKHRAVFGEVRGRSANLDAFGPTTAGYSGTLIVVNPSHTHTRSFTTPFVCLVYIQRID